MLNSSVAWLDFADSDRRRMMEVVSLFKDRDTRDELGLGSIRDAFADVLFPGTSTLQTRARYFLFVPWLYGDYEQRKVASDRVARRLKRDEIRLIQALKAAGETDGVIGARSGASLQRFPASIYWNGLRRWGILCFHGSQDQYHRSLDGLHVQRRFQEYTDDHEPVGGWTLATWDPAVPERPSSFPQQVDFGLTYREASYLRERLMISCPESLLAYMVDHCAPAEGVDFAWLHPEVTAFPRSLGKWLIHARNFSETMVGATLLYNLMLAELRGDEALVFEYLDFLGDWREVLAERAADLQSWDRELFWSLVGEAGHIPPFTRRFVNAWLETVLMAPIPMDVSSSQQARNLVREREVWLKRGRSRFESPRHLEIWSGAAGTAPLDYRWPVASRIANDIIRGLGRR